MAEEQHGFVGGRSCVSNLLETIDAILDMIAEGAPVDVLYLDFCKAFDTVPHHRLLVKLESYGIVGSTLEIIRDFLSNRSMKVVVGGEFSQSCKVTSGVPQGSVLGPLLFLLFINDLPESVKSQVMLFADDVKLLGNANEGQIIKSDIAMLEEWENIWLLRFNPEKCKVLHIDMNNNPMNEYVLDNVPLTSIESECDLGVNTNTHLNWSVNIKEAMIKANRMTAWITRNLISRSREVMLMVYKALVRPHIEYCVHIWSPVPGYGNWSIILELEKIQRRFTRLIDNIGPLPYSQRLNQLNLTTLAERRIRADLIETYKIVSGSVDYGKALFNMSRSGHNLVSRARVGDKLRREYFSERVIQYWNKLPASVQLSTSVDSFKIKLSEYKKNALKSHSIIKGNYWEVSDEVLRRIETVSCVSGRSKFVEYLCENPWTAKYKGINISHLSR